MTPPRRTNGEPVTRAELGAHLERIDTQLSSLHEKLDDLASYVKAPPRWISARITTVIDRGVIVGVSAVIAYIATHS